MNYRWDSMVGTFWNDTKFYRRGWSPAGGGWIGNAAAGGNGKGETEGRDMLHEKDIVARAPKPS